jgi:asparagine synthetase A
LGLTAMSIYFISQRKRDMAIRKVFGSSAGMERARLLRFSLLSLLAIYLSMLETNEEKNQFEQLYIKYKQEQISKVVLLIFLLKIGAFL